MRKLFLESESRNLITLVLGGAMKSFLKYGPIVALSGFFVLLGLVSFSTNSRAEICLEEQAVSVDGDKTPTATEPPKSCTGALNQAAKDVVAAAQTIEGGINGTGCTKDVIDAVTKAMQNVIAAINALNAALDAYSKACGACYASDSAFNALNAERVELNRLYLDIVGGGCTTEKKDALLKNAASFEIYLGTITADVNDKAAACKKKKCDNNKLPPRGTIPSTNDSTGAIVPNKG